MRGTTIGFRVSIVACSGKFLSCFYELVPKEGSPRCQKHRIRFCVKVDSKAPFNILLYKRIDSTPSRCRPRHSHSPSHNVIPGTPSYSSDGGHDIWRSVVGWKWWWWWRWWLIGLLNRIIRHRLVISRSSVERLWGLSRMNRHLVLVLMLMVVLAATGSGICCLLHGVIRR